MIKIMKPLAAAVVLANFMVPTALADDHQYELSLGGGHYFFDNDRNIDDENFGGIGLGYVVNENVTAEGWWTKSDTGVDNSSTDVEAEEFRLDGLYHLGTQGKVTPFLVAGIGHMTFDPDGGEKHEETRVNFGAGIKAQLAEHFNLRADARAYHSDDSNATDLGLLVALTYQFGGSAKPVAVVPAPAPMDTDGDGVMDDQDQCPDTAASLKVDGNGCPITLMEKVAIELEVNFGNNSSVVTSDYTAEIKRVADFMAQYQGTVVEIQGHTDDRGKASYNQWLSEQRANGVAKVLVEELGVAAERVTSKGYGEAMPKVSNDTAENRATNRRVVAEVSAEVTLQEAR